jgi:hypothetical protein
MTPKTKRFTALVLVLVLVLAGAASASPASTPARRAQGTPDAQGVAGAWTMSYTTRDGVKMASTLTLKIEEDKLTGTISSPRGSVPLNEASVKGDDVAFAIERVGFGDRIRIEYTGKVKGDTMTLKMKVGARDPIDVRAKRGAAGPP